MAELTLEEFFHNTRQMTLANAETNEDFLSAEFAQILTNELMEAGVIEGFEFCHYRAPAGGIQVDGNWFPEDGEDAEDPVNASVDLFILDFENRETLASLTQTAVNAIFKRLENFFTASAEKYLAASLEESSLGYGLARTILARKDKIKRVNLYLLSERVLSERLKALDEKKVKGWTFTYHIWDISRFHRLETSRGAREALEIDLTEIYGCGIPCLPASVSTQYRSYLVAVPASILADLYGKYGSRLLEQNVRSFLQVRGNVNKGIRNTILKEPEMFFAYNNGITATARRVDVVKDGDGTLLTTLEDLQIVNGGQTTASLYHSQAKDKASLSNIFVQMKLSVIDEDKIEEVVPKISEYANTQNKVNAADFFSNHAYHLRMEEFSRRVWAPAQGGAQRETKWFYERARGQYADEQGKLTAARKARFLAEYSRAQMFTKTDLGKFENVWDDNPRYVNLGAQKNFAQFAERTRKEWEKHPDQFNEAYYKRAIARAIIFRKTEKIVSAQPWYNGGYRANIVAYTLAMLSQVCAKQKKVFNFKSVWQRQDVSPATIEALEITSKVVHDFIMNPTGKVSNVGEWCKRPECWLGLQGLLPDLITALPSKFFNELVSVEEAQDDARTAVKDQKMLNGIEAQTEAINVGADAWKEILSKGRTERLFTEKEIQILNIATQIPDKIPSEKQSLVLMQVLEKAKRETIYPG